MKKVIQEIILVSSFNKFEMFSNKKVNNNHISFPLSEMLFFIWRRGICKNVNTHMLFFSHFITFRYLGVGVRMRVERVEYINRNKTIYSIKQTKAQSIKKHNPEWQSQKYTLSFSIKCSKWAKSQNRTLKVTVTMKMYPKSAKSENHLSILKNA